MENTYHGGFISQQKGFNSKDILYLGEIVAEMYRIWSV